MSTDRWRWSLRFGSFGAVRHVVTWMLVPFLLVHFFLGHKELRFFFPALFFAPWFIVLMFRELPRRWFGARVWRYVLGVLVAVNAGIMGYCLAQPRPEICFYKMMQEYCRGKKEVVALGLVPTGVGYGYIEDILEPGRIVEIRFYMPRNLRPLCFDTQEALEALVEKWRATLPDAEIIPISAREGFNIAGLFDRILALLPEGEPFYPKDTLTDKTLRFFASEIIREKILKFYDKEIPYCCEIEIEEYREEPGIDRISAVIYVARNSQKGILIGHKGEKLKKVGRQAREELEEFLRKKVFLQLFVKVSDDWRNDERQLRRFGYEQE